jgi:organic radical activating enzyme
MKTTEKVRTRIFEDKNYFSIYNNGLTLRFQIRDNKPILDLDYPEFYDIKVTNYCNSNIDGKENCKFCYQNSTNKDSHYENIINKFKDYFSKMNDNQKPYQIAFGGGEPTTHPDFIELLKATHKLGITPNYTTNGINLSKELLEVTNEICGGVAISAHPHLESYWIQSLNELLKLDNIKKVLHFIISDNKSIEYFNRRFIEYKDKIDYFVLLPYTVAGRATPIETNFDKLFDLLKSKTTKELSKIAFGAKFYEHLKQQKNIPVSLYEPEIMSKFLDMKDMKLYGSSFEVK